MPLANDTPIAHGYSIEVCGLHTRLAEKLIDEECHLLGVVATLVALAERHKFAIVGKSHRAYISACFNRKYKCHISFRFYLRLTFSALSISRFASFSLIYSRLS